jgi:hypothetical protein
MTICCEELATSFGAFRMDLMAYDDAGSALKADQPRHCRLGARKSLRIALL